MSYADTFALIQLGESYLNIFLRFLMCVQYQIITSLQHIFLSYAQGPRLEASSFHLFEIMWR